MNASVLPDVASQGRVDHAIPLSWVGMHGIALPVALAQQRVAAYVDAGVSLDKPDARGIHMSRLYLAFRVRVVHMESLHAHEAVAESSWERESR